MTGGAPWMLRLICVTAVLFGGAERARSSTVEAAIKATYLYKFPPFIDWPPSAMAASRVFTICVVGGDPLGGLLDQAVAGQQVKDRPIVVRRFAVLTGDPGCQIVYAVGSAAQPVSAILAALRGKPVLTVTDEASDPTAKGILNFVIVDDRVRFEIDARAAAEDGLNISSKLLSLAINVRT